MSSMHAVHTMASAPVNPTVAREVRWNEGAIVKVAIAKDARKDAVPIEGGEIPYLQFGRSVRGGTVYCYVHTDQDLAGRTITARAIVMERVLANGQRYLYLDFEPVDPTTPITHRLSVVTNEEGLDLNEDWVVVETPMPVCGAIVFSGPDDKVCLSGTAKYNVPLRSERPRMVPERQPVRTSDFGNRPPSGDSQFQRLLAQGWQFDREDELTITLFRMKGDERRTLVHRKPRAPDHKKAGKRR